MARTKEEYADNMNTLTAALCLVHAMTDTISDEDLDAMVRTIDRDDGLAFLLVRPLDFNKTTRSLDQQRAVIKLHRDIRAFIKTFETAAALPAALLDEDDGSF